MGNRFDDWLNAMKLGEYVHKKGPSEENGKHTVMCILSLIGAAAIIATIAYAIYRYMNPDYLDDFDDDFEDYEDNSEDYATTETAQKADEKTGSDTAAETAK
jgi:hypothetical protein